MTRFIHTADWHLGMQAHFLPDEARARFAQERFDAVRRIADLAREEGCDFVVVAGDVFDSNHVDRQMVARAVDALSSFSVPVLLLPGNHDPLDPSSIYRTAEWLDRKPTNIVVLAEVTALLVPGRTDTEIVGAPWQSKNQLGDPVTPGYDAAASGGSAIRVVVGHGIVDELSPDRDDPSLINADGMRNAIRTGSVHYIALGDRHSVFEIPGTDCRVWYSGTPVSSDYGETDPNEVLLVELGQGTCIVERRTIGSWAFDRQSFDLNGAEDVRTLDRWLDAVPSKHTTVVKLALSGTLSLAANALLEEVLERHRMTFASLNSWERQSDLVVAPDDADLADLNVSGYVKDTLEELRTEADGAGDQAIVARDALNLLYRLAR